MHREHVRRRIVAVACAAALGGAALIAVPLQVAGASVSGPSPITYQSSVVPLLNLGTVNFNSIAGTSSSTGTATTMMQNSAESTVGPGLGHGPLLISGAINGGASVGWQRDHGNDGLQGFAGISGPGQAAVNGGINVGDLEPPDQGLCVGPDGHGRPLVMEIINNAFGAYSQSGTQELATTPTYALFNQPSTAFLSDPRCMYDASTHRWFFTEFVVGSPSVQFIAVSQTSDPLGNYSVFGIDTTDTANPAGDCPCFGDFDQIGADANGFYIATNEFGQVSGFNGAVLYGISKLGLEFAADGGPVPSVARYAVTSDAFGQPYHISPAATPSDGDFANNQEFFVESNSNANSDNHLLVYALSNTRSLLFGGVPSLSATEIVSEPYAFPPNAVQQAGPTPLGSILTGGCSVPPNATGVCPIQTDFNAVQEVTYSEGSLYGEMSTAVGNPSTPNAGIAWFKLDANRAPWGVNASVDAQGYVQSSADLMYPDVVVNGEGQGFLDFSLSGTSNYPSTADMKFNPHSGPTGPINVTGTGTAPEDGFSCYTAFAGPFYGGCRWGDYSGGQTWNGRVFMAGEYIPPSARDFYTNWGTFIWSRPIS